jgi:chemotaxis methyl-accepting protein methylase
VVSLQAAQDLLQRHPRQLRVALNALLIGVTGLFREPTVFEFLHTQILPAWAARRNSLRVWSAGCSTGQELYSMAVLLAETGLLERSYLLGTDCRADAIAAARSVHVPQRDLDSLGRGWRDRYFQPARGGWRPIESLRRQIHWKVANLLAGVEAGPWDVILWRNVAIYLTPRRAESLWRQLATALAAGGVLVVGKAERPPSGVRLNHVSRCLYRAGAAGRGQPLSAPILGQDECLRRFV